MLFYIDSLTNRRFGLELVPLYYHWQQAEYLITGLLDAAAKYKE